MATSSRLYHLGIMRYIIIDTREQKPFDFPLNVPIKRATLKTGDYAIEGDNFFSIERKSKADFIGTIFHDWARFKRELQRMDESRFVAKVIVVEADFTDFLFTENSNGELTAPNYTNTSITPQAIITRIAELALMNVTVLLCKNAEYAATMAYYLLLNRLKQLNKIEI